MNKRISPPFDYGEVLAPPKRLENAWNSHPPEHAIKLISNDRKSWGREAGLRGIAAIARPLRRKGRHAHNSDVKTELWTHAFSGLAAGCRIERQDAVNGPWYRTRGNARVQIDNNGLIRQCDLSRYEPPIEASDRRQAHDTR